MPNPQHPWYTLTKKCAAHNARLVAVSKFRSPEEIRLIYAMGQRLFGENRVQELVRKAPLLPPDIEWHLIGHLQTNKVREALPFASCIQSLDREKLWDKLQQEAGNAGRRLPCLLQIKIAAEETKYGWSFEALEEVLDRGKHLACHNVVIIGVMGMATLTDDEAQIRNEMRYLRRCFERLREKYFPNDPAFNNVSMGMSSDYGIALEEGSTMVRAGSLLFDN